MRKFFLIQAVIVAFGMASLVLVRKNMHDYGLLVTDDETAVASLPANLYHTYDKNANASRVTTAEQQLDQLRKSSEKFGYKYIIVLDESKGDNCYASGCAIYPMEIKQSRICLITMVFPQRM